MLHVHYFRLRRATEVKRRATDPTTGRKMASVQRIEGVGHLVSVSSARKGYRLNVLEDCSSSTQSIGGGYY